MWFSKLKNANGKGIEFSIHTCSRREMWKLSIESTREGNRSYRIDPITICSHPDMTTQNPPRPQHKITFSDNFILGLGLYLWNHKSQRVVTRRYKYSVAITSITTNRERTHWSSNNITFYILQPSSYHTVPVSCCRPWLPTFVEMGLFWVGWSRGE